MNVKNQCMNKGGHIKSRQEQIIHCRHGFVQVAWSDGRPTVGDAGRCQERARQARGTMTTWYSRRHTSNTRALVERCDGRHLELLKNGLFGAVEVFNKLPEDKRALTKTTRLALRDGHPRWTHMFSGRVLYR